jgi:DNA repair protein RadC
MNIQQLAVKIWQSANKMRSKIEWKTGQTSVIIGHNHPSGSLHIGNKDKEVTRRMKESGGILGIKLDDHIVVASDGFASAL